jgi:hypothetical protein
MPEKPRVALVKRAAATPQIRALYDEIQDALGIPWLPANFQAYAAYPALLGLLWSKVARVARSEMFLQRSLALRDLAYREVGSWYWRGSSMPGLEPPVRKRIRWELEAFEYGNCQLLLLQALWDLALRDEVVGVTRATEDAREGGHPFRVPPIRLVSEARASERSRKLFEDIRATLGLPLINSDYQAFAKWPDFLRLGWAQARRWRSERVYFELCGALTREAHAYAMTLSPPVALGVSDLRAAVGEGEGDLENAQRLIQLFSSLLPGLMVNDAIFLFALEGPMFAQPPREDLRT